MKKLFNYTFILLTIIIILTNSIIFLKVQNISETKISNPKNVTNLYKNITYIFYNITYNITNIYTCSNFSKERSLNFYILSKDSVLNVKIAISKHDGLFINVDKNLYTIRFQQGVKIAIRFCEKFTGKKLGIVFYTNNTNYILDGKSASAMVALACIALVLNKSLKDDIIVTGEINLNGDLLPIYDVDKKIRVAKDNGFKTVIIPHQNKPFEKHDIRIIRAKNLVEIIPIILYE